MSQQRLHPSDVGVVPHEVDRKGVPEGVGVHFISDRRLLMLRR
jgi:hypothetical protein